MKVLIISELFYPQNVIGAVRPTKIAKKLLEKGYEVDVFTRYRVSADEIKNKKLCSSLVGFEDYTPPSKAAAAVTDHGKLYKTLSRIYQNIRRIISAKNIVDVFESEFVKNPEVRDKKYDVVFSTFGPLSSLFCGMCYKKLHPETKWICDFRDPVVVKYVSPVLRPVYRYIEKSACKKADAIVAVSNGYLDRISKGKYQDKAYMIPNGYDLNDMGLFGNEEKKRDKLHITYVGALYGGDRDLSPLFRAISELIDEKAVDEKLISVIYAGREFEVLKAQAKKYNGETIVCDYGLINREDCIRLQANSDILLLSTWNDKNEYGVFPGKMLEYMLIKKPIISLTNGNLPNGEITQVIREGNFGVAYEEACDGKDYIKLKEYIKKSYEEFKTAGEVEFEPNQAVLDRYNYENIIKRLEGIING